MERGIKMCRQTRACKKCGIAITVLGVSFTKEEIEKASENGITINSIRKRIKRGMKKSRALSQKPDFRHCVGQKPYTKMKRGADFKKILECEKCGCSTIHYKSGIITHEWVKYECEMCLTNIPIWRGRK
jgi:hypothetical protein